MTYSGIIGPHRCYECNDDYGHLDDCSEHPKNKPFEPTAKLRWNKKKVLEQLFVRPDGKEKWQPVPKKDEKDEKD